MLAFRWRLAVPGTKVPGLDSPNPRLMVIYQILNSGLASTSPPILTFPHKEGRNSLSSPSTGEDKGRSETYPNLPDKSFRL